MACSPCVVWRRACELGVWCLLEPVQHQFEANIFGAAAVFVWFLCAAMIKSLDGPEVAGQVRVLTDPQQFPMLGSIETHERVPCIRNKLYVLGCPGLQRFWFRVYGVDVLPMRARV